MKDEIADLIRCPRCGGRVIREAADRDQRLRCRTCDEAYPVEGGIPRMAVSTATSRKVAASFGFQWLARANTYFERDTLYGLSPDAERRNFLTGLAIEVADLSGKTVLDAGCGDGFLLTLLSQYPVTAAIGIDISASIDLAHERTRGQANAMVLQADIFAPPLATDAFDYVWCEGVLVHTEDPRKGFGALSRLVKPGGRLYVWVYPSERLSIYQRIRDIVRIGHRLPSALLVALCYALALPLTALRHLRRAGSAESLRTVAFALFDNLSPVVQTRHSVAEVRSWFEEHGFTDLKQTGSVGMSGTKGK
jgi:SAM-dependent methyltransferase/uncharacterized protein YbaR (Trm112 family)